MYDFTYKLFNVALQKVKILEDYLQILFDGRGNYSMGIKNN